MRRIWDVSIVVSIDDERGDLTLEQVAERGFEAIRDLEAPIVAVQLKDQKPPAPAQEVDLEEVWMR